MRLSGRIDRIHYSKSPKEDPAPCGPDEPLRQKETVLVKRLSFDPCPVLCPQGVAPVVVTNGRGRDRGILKVPLGASDTGTGTETSPGKPHRKGCRDGESPLTETYEWGEKKGPWCRLRTRSSPTRPAPLLLRRSVD